jgi:hypothetical protein
MGHLSGDHKARSEKQVKGEVQEHPAGQADCSSVKQSDCLVHDEAPPFVVGYIIKQKIGLVGDLRHL